MAPKALMLSCSPPGMDCTGNHELNCKRWTSTYILKSSTKHLHHWTYTFHNWEAHHAGFLKWVTISRSTLKQLLSSSFCCTGWSCKTLITDKNLLYHHEGCKHPSCIQTYWCFHKDFLLIKERLFLQHIFSHWFCFCKPSPNISSHFRQVSSNSKTNLFPNTNYFLTLLNFTIWLLFILSPRSFQSRFHYFYTALILFKSPNLRRDLWNLQFVCVEPPKLSIMFPIFSPAAIHSQHLLSTTILLHFAQFLHLFDTVYDILPKFYIS